MSTWTLESLNKVIYHFSAFSTTDMNSILETMNSHYSPELYQKHREHRRNALLNTTTIRDTIKDARQYFPPYLLPKQLQGNPSSLKGFGIVFTAGGEGERLRLSLLKRGIPAGQLHNFTKATFPLPDFHSDFGTLHANLAMISHFCTTAEIDIPVVVTTGPQGSVTAVVIPELLKKYDNFGLKHIRVIAQDERLHLTNDEKVVFQNLDGVLRPVTQPDETGGPLMKLKQPDDKPPTTLDWLESLGCSNTILVQATALYNQTLLPLIAEALSNHDCCGVGIMRTQFPETDPFGTYISLQKAGKIRVIILEQDMRNAETRTINDSTGTYYLPFNTGFYAFRNQLLKENDLPDFATPPKEILPELQRSPKIGYAATDLISCARNPVILAIDQSMYGVLKTADDLAMLSAFGKKYTLDLICQRVVSY